jgi:hypothetical protein
MVQKQSYNIMNSSLILLLAIFYISFHATSRSIVSNFNEGHPSRLLKFQGTHESFHICAIGSDLLEP